MPVATPTRRRTVVASVAAGLTSVLPAACADPAPPTGEPGVAVVARIVDGDTLDVEIAGRTERVRLLGIDTPESVRPDAPVDCFGPEASARAAELLPPGTEVRLQRDVEARDRFGRLLAHVRRVDDGLHVNLDLVRSGHAETLTIEPNVAHRAELAAAASDARAAGAGLWGAC